MTDSTLTKIVVPSTVHAIAGLRVFRELYFVACKCGWKSGMHGGRFGCALELDTHFEIERLSALLGSSHKPEALVDVYTDTKSTCSCGWSSRFTSSQRSAERMLKRHMKKALRNA